LAENAHDAVGAGDAHVRLARGREAEEEVAGEQRLVEHDPAVAPPARHAQARQEDVEALAFERALDLRLVLVARPDGEPALVGGAEPGCFGQHAQSVSFARGAHVISFARAHGTMSSVGCSGPTKSSPSWADSRWVRTSVTPS